MVPYVQEAKATKVSVPVHPAAHGDVFTNICFCDLACAMAARRPAHGALQGMGRIGSCIQLLHICCCWCGLETLHKLGAPVASAGQDGDAGGCDTAAATAADCRGDPPGQPGVLTHAQPPRYR